MTNAWVRTDFSRGEQVTGLAWLLLGAVLSLLLEVVYLGTRLDFGGANVAFPYTIAVAFLFNLVLTRTARLWSDHPGVMLAPLGVWTAGFVAILIAGDLGPVQALGSNIRTVLLLGAGIAGGVWPLFRSK